MNNESNFISENSKNRFFEYFYNLTSVYNEPIINDRYLDVSAVVIDKITEIIPASSDIRVLVIVCNSINEAEIFNSKGYSVTAITINKAITKEALNNKNIELIYKDQSFTDFANKSFDIIWSKHTLQKSIFPNYTLKEFYRILREGGLLYIETPSENNVFEKHESINNFSLTDKTVWKKEIEEAGFNVIDSVDVNLNRKTGNEKDVFWMFFCNKYKKSNLNIVNSQANERLVLALSKGENFGWGVCSKYLKKEVSKLYNNVLEWDFEKDSEIDKPVEGKVFHALTGIEFESISKIRGTKNYGYTFFENELLPKSIENATKYDIVIGGSTWCKDKMLEKGISNVDVLIQGIDPEIFYPMENKQSDDVFVVFSGGKFELRKGQDSVLKAIGILQKKYSNIVLVNAWYNMWPQTMDLMFNSPYIKFEHYSNNWLEQMNRIYELNDIDPARVATYEIIPNTQLRDIYALTDIGVFPNRCEGGTNLVLMEYMACGRPVIASYTSGHKDILTDDNSYPLKQMKPFRLYDNQNKLWADWEDISINEFVDKIEYAYHNRNDIRKKGEQAGKDMQKLTWQNSAKDLIRILGI